jgi:hypothetical protein
LPLVKVLEVVQVSVLSVQDQSVPLMAVAVIPVGSVSVTVTRELELA